MGNFTDAIRLPSAKFEHVGTVIEGTVVEMNPEATIPTFDNKGKIVPGVNEKNEDGTDKLQVDVTLELADGTQTVLHTAGGVYWAIGRALATVKADDLAVGDHLSVEYTGDAEPTAKGRNGAKQYTAKIEQA